MCRAIAGRRFFLFNGIALSLPSSMAMSLGYGFPLCRFFTGSSPIVPFAKPLDNL
jgi:hypothetical protein